VAEILVVTLFFAASPKLSTLLDIEVILEVILLSTAEAVKISVSDVEVEVFENV
jgi:hypothetical protein